MCTVACPYGRLQNVLADRDTVLVAYDADRGEPRARVLDRLKERVYGDCVDCRSCVNACPTGTDIRRGLQLECIGSAQCVDACHGVMTGMGKKPGLIRYTSAAEQVGGTRRLWRPRTVIYLVLLGLAWGFLGVLVATRADALVEITRGGREPYRLLPNGLVANQQRVRVTNQLDRPQSFTIEVLEPPGAQLILSESPLQVAPEKLVTVNAVTTVGEEVFQNGQATVRYRVTSDTGVEQPIEFLLLGPYR
jgi:cytochrome c oxidase accessory protein FixG